MTVPRLYEYAQLKINDAKIISATRYQEAFLIVLFLVATEINTLQVQASRLNPWNIIIKACKNTFNLIPCDLF